MAITAVIGGAVIGAGGSMLAASSQSSASKKAAETTATAATQSASLQADATNKATQATLDMYNQTRQDLSPYTNMGASALPVLASFLGPQGPINSTLGQLSSLYGPQGPVNSNLSQLQGLYGQNGPISSLMGLGPHGAAGMMDQLRQYPGYQFAMDEGQRSLDRSAASRGTLLSGGQLRASQEFGQGLASQQFGNYYNQLGQYGSGLAGVGNQLAGYGSGLGGLAAQYGTYGNSIAGLVNTGENAAAQTGNAGSAAASSVSNALTSGANAQANTLMTGAQGQSQAFQNAGTATASGYAGAANNIGSLLNNSAITGALNNYGIGSVTSTPMNSYFTSDRRLKRDIRKIGKTESGLAIYSYKFKDSPRVHIGVMAQDVEKIAPDAVATTKGGIKLVDYGKVSRLPAIRHMPLKRAA